MSIKSFSILATAALGLFAGAAQAQVPGLANMGFETAPNSAGEFADGWQGSNSIPAVRSSAEAHSGSFSALLAPPSVGGGSGLFQNSVDHGGLLAVDPLNWGTAPTLSFWYKGNASETGNFNYALRYLNAAGGILNIGSEASITLATGNVDRPWTLVTRTPDTVIPVNTAAVFLEMTLAAGPSGTFPGCGPTGSFCNWGTAAIFVDDIGLTLAHPIPEPSTYALMLLGLGAVGAVARRRRSAA